MQENSNTLLHRYRAIRAKRAAVGLAAVAAVFTLPNVGFAQTSTLFPDAPSDSTITATCTDPVTNTVALCTRGANRGTRRHDDSGRVPSLDTNGNPDTPDGLNFHFRYWESRRWSFVIYDHVAAGTGSTVAFEVDIKSPHEDNGDPNQSRAQFRCFEDYGTITDFHRIPAFGATGQANNFVELSPFNRTRWRYTVGEYAGEELLGPLPSGLGGLDDDPFFTARALQNGDLIDCELTVRWQDVVEAGEIGNYYAVPLVYEVGRGVVGYTLDPYNTVDNGVSRGQIRSNDAMLGGDLTSPVGIERERSRSGMQLATNIQLEHVEDWMFGRRAFRTNLNDGSHFDPSSPANGAQPIFTPLNLAIQNPDIPDGINACARCHLNDAKSTIQNQDQFVPPVVWGMGLLEAIDEMELATWADPNDLNGDGISGRLNVLANGFVGRFGYRAEHESVRSQTLAVLADEMGVTTVPAAQLEQLVLYLQLTAPPSARMDSISSSAGARQFDIIGCDDCHRPLVTTARHPLKELRTQVIRPYTDLRICSCTISAKVNFERHLCGALA